MKFKSNGKRNRYLITSSHGDLKHLSLRVSTLHDLYYMSTYKKIY